MGEAQNVWGAVGIAYVPEQVVYNPCCFLGLLVVVILSCKASCLSWKVIDSVCSLFMDDYWFAQTSKNLLKIGASGESSLVSNDLLTQ